MSSKILAPFLVASPNYMQSSAKKRWDICGPLLLTLTPFIIPLFIADLNRLDKPSPHKRKRNGLSGSPCLKPLVGENLTPLNPLMMTE